MRAKNQRGQATPFIILGILIFAVAILLWFLRGQFFFGPVTPLTLEEKGITPIKDHVNDCIQDIAPDYFERIGLQGGYLSTPTDTYRKHNDIPISYLCYNMNDAPTCYNRYLTQDHMEDELAQAITEGLSTCLNVKKFARGMTLALGTLNVNVDIGDYKSIITTTLPITLTKNDVTVTQDTFTTPLDVPLGALYNVAQDIINVETQTGEFEQLTYMLAHKGQFIIEKKKPYPDKLYILTTKDSKYTFQFFIQGEPL